MNIITESKASCLFSISMIEIREQCGIYLSSFTCCDRVEVIPSCKVALGKCHCKKRGDGKLVQLGDPADNVCYLDECGASSMANCFFISSL